MTTAPSSDSKIAYDWKSLLFKLGPFIGLVAVWILFAILKGGSFTHVMTQKQILLQATVVGTAALGATLIIISGGIDLSVGATLALTMMVLGGVMRWAMESGWSPGAASMLGVGAGLGVGLLCGLAIGSTIIGHLGRVVAVAIGGLAALVWLPESIGYAGAIPVGIAIAAALWYANKVSLGTLELSPFIVTLGMMGILRGAAKGVLGKTTVTTPEETWVHDLMRFGDGLTSILPWGTWIFLVISVLTALMLRYTAFGRHIFAIGSNEETARLCGINVPFTKLMVYTIGIGLAGVAGVMQFSYISQGSATEGMGFELLVIAAVVIGGASLAGGEGSILGTMIGALLMFVVKIGCQKMGWPTYVQEVVTGIIIVVAVSIDRLRHRKPS
ncbi:MAG: ABC transporter permease [Planctomycetota bacterium]|jgi:ribose/xylose/arabinose/galactoside ABC-type transport system permease subunit